MGWKAQSYISSWEQPLPGTRLRTATPNFLPVAAADRLFHLQFLLFRWVEITAINIDGPVHGNGRTEYWQITIKMHVNCIEISDWKLQSWRWRGSGGLQSVQGRGGDEKTLSGPSYLWLVLCSLQTCAHLLFFSQRSQRISTDLNCTEKRLVPTGLSLQDGAEHPGIGGVVLAQESALHIQRRQQQAISYRRWPCGTLRGFNSLPGCWERWRSLAMTQENITNSSCKF